jgi:hypothetical protein
MEEPVDVAACHLIDETTRLSIKPSRDDRKVDGYQTMDYRSLHHSRHIGRHSRESGNPAK